MSFDAKVVDVFLSSPSDVNSERQFIDQYAAEWNRIRSRSTGIYISILRWEDLVAPAMMTRVQEVATNQIGLEYDVYLSVMWTRFGTPTGVADSGTEEEFNLALARLKAGERLRLAALFKSADVDPDRLDLAQFAKVKDFKNRLASEGMFYRDFNDESSLRSILNLLFEQIAKDFSAENVVNSTSDQDGAVRGLQTEITSTVKNANDTEDDDSGLIDVGEEFVAVTELFILRLQAVLSKENDNTRLISQINSEMDNNSGLVPLSEDRAKVIMRAVAVSLSELAGYYDEHLESIESDALKMADLIDKDLRIRLEFDEPLQAASGVIGSIRTLSLNIADAIEVTRNLIEATSSIPRLSTDLNRAKKKLEKSRVRLLDSFTSLKNSIDNSIMYFDINTKQ